MTYWQRLRLVSLAVLAAMVLLTLLLWAAAREPAPPATRRTDVSFGL